MLFNNEYRQIWKKKPEGYEKAECNHFEMITTCVFKFESCGKGANFNHFTILEKKNLSKII